MAIEINLSADCKTLTITGGSTDAGVEVWINEINYPMIDPAGSPTNNTAFDVDLENLGGINGFPPGELTVTWDNIPGITTEQLNGVIKVIVNDVCDKCPFAYFGQYCMKCKATHDWKDIPVTIEDTKTKAVRPHYIPDWCPFMESPSGVEE